jgi:hypothetical protein
VNEAPVTLKPFSGYKDLPAQNLNLFRVLVLFDSIFVVKLTCHSFQYLITHCPRTIFIEPWKVYLFLVNPVTCFTPEGV